MSMMEDHKEEVGCEFSGVGCNGLFRREDQEEHTRQNSQKHLTLTASLAVETKQQFQQKLLEQDKIHKEEEEKLRQKIEEQEKKIEELAKKHNDEEQKLKQKIEEQEKKFEGQEKKFEGQEKKLNAQVIKHKEEVVQKLAEQKKMLEELFESKLRCLDQKLLELTKKSNQNEIDIKKVSGMISLDRRFEMTNFSAEKAKDELCYWYSPAMYTHVCGYKFCIGVDANGYVFGRRNVVYVDVWGIPGDCDDQLEWPAKAKFTIKLINQQGKGNATFTTDTVAWEQPVTAGRLRIKYSGYHFIEHSILGDFLVNDTLHFNVSKVEIL